MSACVFSVSLRPVKPLIASANFSKSDLCVFSCILSHLHPPAAPHLTQPSPIGGQMQSSVRKEQMVHLPGTGGFLQAPLSLGRPHPTHVPPLLIELLLLLLELLLACIIIARMYSLSAFLSFCLSSSAFLISICICLICCSNMSFMAEV